MTQVGTGKHTYELVRDWPRMPQGVSLGVVSRVATDSQDRVYVFQRRDPPVVVLDREGNYLGCWGMGAVKEAHGLKIVDDVARLESRHIHGVGVDSRGDIYAGLTVDRSVDKFVRVG